MGSRSGSSQLVTQVVYTHANQTIANSKSVSSAPRTVGWASSRWESWVTANTYTRSKNNSMLVARSAPS